MTIADRLREEGFQLGEQKGIQLGKQEGMKTVAVNMIIEGQDLALIARVTGLTEEEVKKLKNSISH